MSSVNVSPEGQDKDEFRTLDILQKIKAGSLDPKSIGPAERRLLIIFLMSEGQSAAEMALLLKSSDRTIERDKQAIRQENTVAKDPKLIEQVVGRLISEAELSLQKIRKFEREKDASPSVKIDGEHRCFQIYNCLVERLQSIGYLPTASQKLEAELTHHALQELSLEQMDLEIKRLKQIEGELPDQEENKAKKQVEAQEVVTEFENTSAEVKDGGTQNG